jgi:hypothetical protein
MGGIALPKQLFADAQPEKRLFISLITRDISLGAAILDIIDNSVNAVVEPYAGRLKTAADYATIAADETMQPRSDIYVDVNNKIITVTDDASGISLKQAQEHIFKFGRSVGEKDSSDRLSVYGIGLKRAIFKIGNRIKMTSDHTTGGFALDLDVQAWGRQSQNHWQFPISSRAPATGGKTGTKIEISDLYEETQRRVQDGLFINQLRESIAKTYAFYLSKFVNIHVNGTKVDPISTEISSNKVVETFVRGDVSCAVVVGIGTPQGDSFRDRSSGWFIFCNGRAVLSADKTALTGWGGGTNGLPIFQPKHRPFLGMVFFVSEDGEQLPWTTTKSGINEDSVVWQQARQYMITAARTVISFLDNRYTEEGTELSPKDLREAAGERVSAIAASVSQKQTFKIVKKAPPTQMRIQYDARIDDIKKIEGYLKRPGMGGAEVGRYTFQFFLKNEVGED